MTDGPSKAHSGCSYEPKDTHCNYVLLHSKKRPKRTITVSCYHFLTKCKIAPSLQHRNVFKEPFTLPSLASKVH